MNGEGDLEIHIKARLLVFNPPIDTVLIGTIKEMTEAGIVVSLGFIDVVLP